MENEITRLVGEEVASLKQYLATQPAALQVNIDGQVPSGRYVIPRSLELIVQHAQRSQICSTECPLVVVIRFLKNTIEVSYPIQPRAVPDTSFGGLDDLAALYRQFYSVPVVNQTNDTHIVSIPLFI